MAASFLIVSCDTYGIKEEALPPQVLWSAQNSQGASDPACRNRVSSSATGLRGEKAHDPPLGKPYTDFPYMVKPYTEKPALSTNKTNSKEYNPIDQILDPDESADPDVSGYDISAQLKT